MRQRGGVTIRTLEGGLWRLLAGKKEISESINLHFIVQHLAGSFSLSSVLTNKRMIYVDFLKTYFIFFSPAESNMELFAIRQPQI